MRQDVQANEHPPTAESATQRPPHSGLSARAKWMLPSWYQELLSASPFRTLYDPFAGDASVARYFKRNGKRVIVGDVLESNYCHARAMVANNERQVSSERLAAWTTVLKDPRVATRFGPWAHRFFSPEETIWLGIWHAHLAAGDLGATERAIGAVGVGLTMRYWRSFNRESIGPKPLEPTQVFSHYVQTLNALVFNNGMSNEAHWGDAYQHAPRVEADLLFCYPPTHLGFQQYPESPTLFEGWVKGDPQLTLPGQVEMIPGPPTLGMPLPSPKVYAEALRRFLARCDHIPVWALAFNDRYPLDEADMSDLVGEFRSVERRAKITVPLGSGAAAPTEKLIIAR
jgi:hypothetical protein